MTQKVTYKNSIKVNLSDQYYDRIEDLAQEKGLSKSAVVRTAIRKKLASEADA